MTDTATFAATAQVLEDTGVNAYLGQVGNIFVKGTLAAAGTIATVEARHAAWIRFINGDRAGARGPSTSASRRSRSSRPSATPASSSSPPYAPQKRAAAGPEQGPAVVSGQSLSATSGVANEVMRLSSCTRSTISGPVSRATRSVPNSSTL